jgi:ABC-type transport system involved in cytochrome c biogenesis permease subunit
MPIEKITIFCFAASYLSALVLELLQTFWPRGVQILLATLFGAAGLLAHTLYLIAQRLSLVSQPGTLLYLSWVLAVFYLCGSIHYRRLAWGVFVLPVVLGLIGLAVVPDLQGTGYSINSLAAQEEVDSSWLMVHVGLFVLAAIGICVAFVASVMYLVQADRLRTKAVPGQGLRLPNLERLERMNRLGINLAFPLLTIGVVIGMALLVHARGRLQSWTDPRILSSVLLWLVFAIVFYLRYGFHLRGRRAAILTIVAFGLLVVSLVTAHPAGSGGAP